MTYLCKVKKLCALIILAIFVASTTELIQVLKLPLLFSHYAEHAEQERYHSFLDYLHDHYVDDDGTISDNDTDRKLPFKECSCFSPLNNGYVPLSQDLMLRHPGFSGLSSPVFPELTFRSLYRISIWQPPKLV